MDTSTIYSKTAKGMTEFNNGGKNLPREQAQVLSMINGKSSIADFMRTNVAMQEEKLLACLNTLVKLGLARIFFAEASALPSAHNNEKLEGGDDGFLNLLPMLEVIELSPQESVQAWAQARRGASELEKTGFYSYGKKNVQSDAVTSHAQFSALVIEDDEELAELLVVLLTEKGFSVGTAADIPAALTAIQTTAPPDLVLLDIVLPGLPGKDGFDILGFIRRHTSWSSVPVVMVTSQVSDEQVLKGLKTGADAYIFKPFKWETLYSGIKSVVRL